MSEFVPHVSFDDLSPSLVDEQARALLRQKQEITFANPFLHIPPQLNPLYTSGVGYDSSTGLSALGSPKKSSFSLDMYLGSKSGVASEGAVSPSPKHSRTDLSGSSNNSASRTPLSAPQASYGKLPEPTRPSALKPRNRRPYEVIKDIDLMFMDRTLEHQLTVQTAENTQQNSGCSHGYTTSAFSNLNEVEDKLMRKDIRAKEKAAGEKGRRKSFAGMSMEELAALEKKYEAASRTNYKVEEFDFGEQTKLYIEPEKSKAIGPTNEWPSTIYPSRPCVDHRALAITKVHRRFEDYVKENGQSDTKGSLRTIICSISGRKHTWSAVDWYVKNLARDGDYLIIATRIPVFEGPVKRTPAPQTHLTEDYDPRNKNQSRSQERKSSITEQGLLVQDIDILARQKCNDILNYYLDKLAHKCVKVTVEIIKDNSTVFALTSAIALYKPDLKIVSTVSTNLHIKFKNGHVKLPNFLMRHFWVPTYVVPYEFIDPALLGEKEKQPAPRDSTEKEVTDSELTALIDKVINRTLTNPFGPKERPPSSDQETDGELGSINSYFPSDPETKRKMQDFEQMGYLRPVPTRKDGDLSKVTSFLSSSKSSRRSSRIQFAGDHSGMYKVKSLIDYDDKDGNVVRKIKSGASTHSKSSLKKHPSAARRVKSVDSPVVPDAKKKTSKFGGFLKKIGIGK